MQQGGAGAAELSVVLRCGAGTCGVYAMRYSVLQAACRQMVELKGIVSSMQAEALAVESSSPQSIPADAGEAEIRLSVQGSGIIQLTRKTQILGSSGTERQQQRRQVSRETA